jgi:hypothetical protein
LLLLLRGGANLRESQAPLVILGFTFVKERLENINVDDIALLK